MRAAPPLPASLLLVLVPVLVLVLPAGPAQAAAQQADACPLAGDPAAAPRPDWAAAGVARDAAGRAPGAAAEDDRVTAVGVAAARGLALSDAVAAARAQAARVLGEQVRLDIASSLRIDETKLTEAGRSVLRASVASVLQASSSVSLRRLAYDPPWFDAGACQVWVRASVSRAEFEQSMRHEAASATARQLEHLLAQAEDAGLASGLRLQALVAAEVLVAGADFSAAPELVAEAYAARAAAARRQLDQAQADEARRQGLQRAHALAYAQFLSATAPAERQAAALRALAPLRQWLAAPRPVADADSGLPFAPRPRLLALLREAGLVCQARALEEAAPSTPSPSPSPASAPAPGAACTATELAAERQHEFLAGRAVRLRCALRTPAGLQPWAQACGLLSQALARQGAVVELAPPPDAAGFQRGLQGGALGAGGPLQVLLLADGRVAQRLDPEPPGAAQYRYEGQVYGGVGGEGVLVQDAYQGLTGWNPVSDAMALDLLGLSAARRLLARLQQNWQN